MCLFATIRVLIVPLFQCLLCVSLSNNDNNNDNNNNNNKNSNALFQCLLCVTLSLPRCSFCPSCYNVCNNNNHNDNSNKVSRVHLAGMTTVLDLGLGPNRQDTSHDWLRVSTPLPHRKAELYRATDPASNLQRPVPSV